MDASHPKSIIIVYYYYSPENFQKRLPGRAAQRERKHQEFFWAWSGKEGEGWGERARRGKEVAGDRGGGGDREGAGGGGEKVSKKARKRVEKRIQKGSKKVRKRIEKVIQKGLKKNGKSVPKRNQKG